MLKSILLIPILLCCHAAQAQTLPLIVQTADTVIPLLGGLMVKATNVYGSNLYFDSSLITHNGKPEKVYYNSFDKQARLINQKLLVTKTRKAEAIVSYQYDSVGRQVHMLTEQFNQYNKEPVNHIVNHEYDKMGLLIAKKEFYSPQESRDSAVVTYVYNNAGQIITETRTEWYKESRAYGYTQAGLITSYEYNNTGRLTGITAKANNSADIKWKNTSKYTPVYDKSGRMTSDTLINYNDGPGAQEWAGANIYLYDENNRLADSITLTKETLDDRVTIRKQMKTSYKYMKQGLPQNKTIFYDSAGQFAVMQKVDYLYKETIPQPAWNNTFKITHKVVHNILTIYTKWKQPQAIAIGIYDMQGKLVSHGNEAEAGEYNKGIQLEDLSPGIYTILLIGDNEAAGGQFFVR